MEKSFLEWIVYIIQNYGLWFLKGAGTTLLISFFGTIIGFIIGLVFASIRTIKITHNNFKKILMKIVNFLISCYVEVFRGTPMMVQAVIIYFGMQEFMGINFSPTVAGLIIVSINTGAYMIEVVRGGIESIDIGQLEASKSIGMNHWQSMIHIILPQTIKNILPATCNEFIINIKDTSVLNVISVTELFFVTKSIKGAIYRTYETFIVVALIYLILTLTITRIIRYIEKFMDSTDKFTPASSTMPIIFVKKSGEK